MNEVEKNEFRMRRLAEAVEKLCDGNRTEFGRRLGYKDGAFVRQMLSGTRPVTEKTVALVEALSGMKGWFEEPKRRFEGGVQLSEHTASSVVGSRYLSATPEVQCLIKLALIEPGETWPEWATAPMKATLTAALETVKALNPNLKSAGLGTERKRHG